MQFSHGTSSTAITENQTATPFAPLILANVNANLEHTIRIRIENGVNEGDLTPQSASLWTRTVVGTDIFYERVFKPVLNLRDQMDAALASLVFAPVEPTWPIGSIETTFFNVSIQPAGLAPVEAGLIAVSSRSLNDVTAIAGLQAGQPVDDTATVTPFATVDVTDADIQGMTATVTIQNGVNRGDFTPGSAAGWTRTVTDSDIVYSRAFASQANVGEAVETALKALVFDPRDNAVAVDQTETTGFLLSLDDGVTPVSNAVPISVVSRGVDDAPTVSGAAGLSVAENAADALLGTFTIGDPDPGAAFSFALDEPGARVVAAAGTVFGQPGTYEIRGGAYDFETQGGARTINVTVKDEAGGAPDQTFAVTATVTNVDEPIVTMPDTVTVREGQSILIASSTLLANDYDPDGQTVVIFNRLGPSHGQLQWMGVGQPIAFAYAAPANYSGIATFTYVAGIQVSANQFTNRTEQTVTVNVVAVADQADVRIGPPPTTPTPVTGVLRATPADTVAGEDQLDGLVVALADGGWGVIWRDPDVGAGSDFAPQMQRFAADGTKVGDPLRIAAVNGPSVDTIATAPTENGFVVAWTDVANGLYVRRFDASGAPIDGGDIAVSAGTFGAAPFYPSVAELADGSFVVTWIAAVIGERNIVMRRFDADGTPLGPEELVHAAPGRQQDPDVAALAGGGFAIVYLDDSQGLGHWVQVYGADGKPQADRVWLGQSSDYTPAVEALADGGFVVVTPGRGFLFDDHGEVVGSFDPYGPSLGSAVQQIFTRIQALPDGGFVIGHRVVNLAPDGTEFMLRRYDAFGNVVGERVFPYEGTGRLEYPAWGTGDSFAITTDGDLVMAWDEVVGGDSNVVTRKFDLGDMRGQEDAPLALPITVALTDTDGSESIASIIVSGLPAGATLSKGTLLGDGTWSLAPGDLPGLTLAPPADYAGTFHLKVVVTTQEASNGDTAARTVVRTITIDPLDDAPGSLAVVGEALGVDENAAPGTVVGTVAALDADGDALAYSLVDDAGGRFVIDPATGQIRVAAGAVLDFETLTQHALVVRATDPSGRSVEGTFTVSVGNVSQVIEGTPEGDDLRAVAGEEAIIRGLGAADRLVGAAANDSLDGGDGDDRLDGGLGADRLFGGAGNDTYFLDDAGDLVSELDASGHDAGGTDMVFSAVAHTLAAGVENLRLTGSAAVDGTGNGLDNLLDGNNASNTLDGGDGNDGLRGGGGDDRLVGGRGNDWFDGGAGDDHLLGGEGNDNLNGALGADRMEGGTGNDDYRVGDAGDLVIEVDNAAGGGIDSVFASISYALTAHVERLNLTGSEDIAGTGNELDNRIIGNAGHNVLAGAGGLDTITGGLGADTFVFASALAGSRDRITDFSAAQGDRVGVLGLDFGLAAGALEAGRFVSGAGVKQGDAGWGQFLFDTTTRTLSWDADGSGAGAAVALATFDNAQITRADILVL